MMTEKEWLEQSDEDKRDFIANKIIGHKSIQVNYLGWQGFGMIVDKLKAEDVCFSLVWVMGSGGKWSWECCVNGSGYTFTRNEKPWYAVILTYAKLKGLVK